LKKLIFALFALSAVAAAPRFAVGAEPIAVPETVRVGLFYNTTARESVRLGIDAEERVVHREDVQGEQTYTSQSGIVSVDGKAYRGSVILKRTDGGNLTVINEVALEDYVAAVISAEMPADFELEALKAQAVCARGYALKNYNKHAAYGFHVCASVDCQAYNGMAAESEKTVLAARQTAGRILTYDGQIAETVYFAASGGHTEDARYVWGSDVPYLKGVADEYESKDCYASTWTKTLSPERLTEILAARGYGVGNAQTVEVLERTASGAVYKLRVTGGDGDKIFTNEACRTLFGYDMLLSQAYTVSRGGGISAQAYGGAVDGANLHMLSSGGLSAYGGGDLRVMGGAGERTLPAAGGDFVFRGRGNGHLVGMSQNGAHGMAQAGFTYEEILTHYYTGTELL
jgi:stage II sporulation protein D